MKPSDKRSYPEIYAAQLPALGPAGQERLHQARVLVVGGGRVGSVLLLNLAAAGIGYGSVADPQVVEWDNGNSFIFCPPGDLGKPKVSVLDRFLGAREHFRFRPIALAVDSIEVDCEISRSDLVICCANTVAGRLAAECKAIRYGKPSMQVAAFDGRERLGGLIALRLPENRWSACFGCYVEDTMEPIGGEGLLSTVTSALAATAANMAVELLSGIHAEIFCEKNLFYFDFATYSNGPLAVQKRKGCRVCG